MASIFDLFRRIEKKDSSVGGKPDFIIAGLGNPGAEYEKTRHNAGFMALDVICSKLGVECRNMKFKALTCLCEINGRKVLLMKPQTYMNLSGEAVGQAASFYKIPPEKILVFCDDVNFDTGVMRIREKGSDAGQRGIRNITEHLGTEAFPRVRIGVGKKPHPDYDLKDWVLGRPQGEDLERMNDCIAVSADIASCFVDGKITDAMSKYNCKK